MTGKIGAKRNKMRQLEIHMERQGYASSRVASRKLQCSAQAVLRDARAGKYRSIRVGQYVFIDIASVRDYYARIDPSAVKVLGLDDWSGAFETDAAGLFVQQPGQ